MSAMAERLVDDLRAALRAGANPDQAAGQQAYMKSTIPYFGLTAPEMKLAFKGPLITHTLPDREDWEWAIRELWDQVTHREEWYAAIGIANHRAYRQWATGLASLPLYEHMIRTGAWWDVCDSIAADLVGSLLRTHPARVTPLIRQWSRDEHLWIRRVSILSQLKAKTQTDRELLADCIQPSLDDKDFFARKGIGWALREFSKTDPDWVRQFVASHEDRLSGLSRREALKWLDKHPDR